MYLHRLPHTAASHRHAFFAMAQGRGMAGGGAIKNRAVFFSFSEDTYLACIVARRAYLRHKESTDCTNITRRTFAEQSPKGVKKRLIRCLLSIWLFCISGIFCKKPTLKNVQSGEKIMQKMLCSEVTFVHWSQVLPKGEMKRGGGREKEF